MEEKREQILKGKFSIAKREIRRTKRAGKSLKKKRSSKHEAHALHGRAEGDRTVGGSPKGRGGGKSRANSFLGRKKGEMKGKRVKGKGKEKSRTLE